MLGQLFELTDIPKVLFLVLLEGLLSADNALVLAIMVRHLPTDQQKKALLYGLGGAFVFRLIAILLAAVVLKLWWLQAVGALYLLWLPIKHFVQHASSDEKRKAVKGGFWATVVAVELTDIAFAIDSVLAGVTFIENRQDKLWVVYFGAIIGIILLRVAAGFFVRLLERFPILDHVAYLLVGWVGVKLAFLAAHAYERTNPERGFKFPEMPHWLFWLVLMSIAIIGALIAFSRENKLVTDDKMDDTLEEALQEPLGENSGEKS